MPSWLFSAAGCASSKVRAMSDLKASFELRSAFCKVLRQCSRRWCASIKCVLQLFESSLAPRLYFAWILAVRSWTTNCMLSFILLVYVCRARSSFSLAAFQRSWPFKKTSKPSHDLTSPFWRFSSRNSAHCCSSSDSSSSSSSSSSTSSPPSALAFSAVAPPSSSSFSEAYEKNVD